MEGVELVVCGLSGLLLCSVALTGNMRPFAAIIPALLVFALLLFWVTSLQSMHMGMAFFLLALIFGFPLLVYCGVLAAIRISKGAALRFSKKARLWLGLAGLLLAARAVCLLLR